MMSICLVSVVQDRPILNVQARLETMMPELQTSLNDSDSFRITRLERIVRAAVVHTRAFPISG